MARRRIEEEIREAGSRPFDKPAEAAEFEAMKRRPVGSAAIPVERYLAARDHNKTMPQYSSSIGATLPSQNEVAAGAPMLGGVLSGWSFLGPGNVGGRARSMLIDPTNPSTMYLAGVSGGVWKSTNAGASWTAIGDILPNLAISSLAMDPHNSSVIYAGTGEGQFNLDATRGAGIFKTTDGGNTWTALTYTTSSPDFHYVNKIVVSPVNSSRLFAATRSGVWRSTDGGTSWSQVLNSASNNGCFDLEMRTDQPADYIFASCGSFAQASIYRNTDASGAGSWSVVYTESRMGLTSLAIAPSNQNVIYALAASLETGNFSEGLLAVFRSTSSGDPGTWTARVRNTSSTKLNTVLLTNPVVAYASACYGGTNSYLNQGWYDNVIAVDPTNSNVVWAGGIDLFRSDDGGANWGLASYWWANPSPGYAHADQHVIVFHPQYNGAGNQTLFVGNDGGIFKTTTALAPVATSTTAPCNSSNTSVTWSNLNNNVGITQFYHGLPYPDGSSYFGGTQDNGTVRGANAGGPNAWQSVLGGDGGYVALDPSNTNTLYAENFGLSIQKSTNGGGSWSNATSGITNDTGFLFISPFTMDPNSSQQLWTGGNYIWRTTNGASSWTQASTSLAPGSVSALAVAPGNSNLVAVGTSNGTIYLSSNALAAGAGTVWPYAQPRGGYVSWVAFDPSNANTIYATYSSFNSLPTDSHVYRTTDGGVSWNGSDGTGATGIPDIPVHSIAVDPANHLRLFVGTDLGVYTSIDGGSTWNLEITGFTAAVTESLTVNTISGAETLYAFTHGRGAWRAPISASTGCSYVLSPSQSFSVTGGSGTITVTAGVGCAWTATSNAAWITVTSGSSGTGNGSIGFSVGANTGAARSGTVTVGGGGINSTFTVNQAGVGGGSNDEISGATLISTLPYTTSENTGFATSNPTDPVHSCTGNSDSKTVWFRYVAGFTGVLAVDTLGSSYDTVLAIYPGTTSAGSELACNDDTGGTLQSRITANVTSGQSYLIEVSGYGASSPGGSLTLDVAQFGSCAVSISPTSASFGSTGGSGSIAVTASSCSWSALSNASWITIISGASGTGNGTLQYTVASNSTGSTRTGTITIGAQTFTVVQSGTCAYILSATAANFFSAGGSGSVTVSVFGSCVWTVSNPVPWITVTSPLSVIGGGTMTYTVAANGSANTRSTTLSIAGQSYTVTQAGTAGFPLNDEIVTATAIPSVPFTSSESTVAATSNASDPVQSCTPGKQNGHTVWYRFVSNLSGVLRIDTFGSSYDTVVSVYPAAVSATSELACDDDAGGGTLQSQVAVAVAIGQTYYIEVSAFDGDNGANLSLHVTSVGNDEPLGATPISSLPYVTTQAVQSATISPGDPSHSCTFGADSATVWFRYTANFSGTVNVNTFGSDYDTVLTAYPGSTSPGAEMACSDDALGGLQSQLSFSVVSGQSYLVEVSAYGASQSGNLVLNAVQLTDDLVETPAAAPMVPYSLTQDIRSATNSPSDPVQSCIGFTGYQTVWFRYVAAFTGAIRVDTLGSDYDTVLTAYSGTPAAATQIACNDDDPVSGTLQSSISINAVSGATYYFEVSSYDPDTVNSNSLLLNLNPGPAAYSAGLQFYPITPCRVADTRSFTGPPGPLGPPSLSAGSSRSFPVLSSACGIPASAVAYSLNVSAVPTAGYLQYVTVWPSGQTMPVASTLNSWDGRIVANAAIIPAGTGGAISIFASDTTDVFFDINGYFAPPGGGGLQFYPMAPCRVADTRSFTGPPGPLGPPSMAAGSTRSFPVLSSSCGIPAGAVAYSLNMSAVPNTNYLGYLTTWAAGQPQPIVSTLNSWTGTIVANAAIVPAGASGAINIFVSDPTDVFFDINGYFAPPGTGGLQYHTVAPCRVADTRSFTGPPGPLGPPSMTAGSTRSFPVLSSSCAIPSMAAAYAFNVTAVPSAGYLQYLTAWATGQPQPIASTLNSWTGTIVPNAAIVPAGTAGAISIFVSNPTDVFFDINGFFAP